VTSVKEFSVAEPATESTVGRGRFEFTDAYSVFDWGRMPDEIPGKGAALCLGGAATFELLESAGAPTHYRGVASDGGPVQSLSDATAPPDEMAIELVAVPELPYTGAGSNGYDYDSFHDDAGDNYLVPLEVVFRNAVPVGSSLRDRRDPADLGLDRDEWPDEPVDLPEPVVEFSTKFEERDRYLDRAAADQLAGRASVDRLVELAQTVEQVVTERAAAAGLDHQDGKIECYWADGEVGVADVAGTFDENRFAHDGQQVSKEVVRQFYRREHPEWVDYRREHPEWVDAVADAKARADAENVADWRPLCDREPPALPASVVDRVAELYAAGADAYAAGDPAGDGWFDAPPLSEAVSAVRRFGSCSSNAARAFDP